MRIIAIGLGGAGCRIVDSLYSTDRKSSKVACIQGLAVDVDESTIRQLKALPENCRLSYPAIDPAISSRDIRNEPTASIDIAEIVSHVNNLESSETDAIVLCLGLGGSMTDIAPHVITSLRSSAVEPIFGLVTLPCLAEGEKRSAKAADDIDILSPLLDGMILFDNETWYKKTKEEKAAMAKREKSLAHRLGFAKDEPELSSELATYHLLNMGIVRRISLILRAGEFKADGGIDLAEVVLDSGEVLNTMKGMGFITIGYAVDRLPSNPLAFLDQFRPKGVFDEENKKKASRIVDLAKQAIYHEISTPCDMTSAHKALVLIAGPSHELSMKGFMTVRKWIDRSIAGLETRSGDYPVVNTKNVAIIVMLSGLENIPRINELREIRVQHTAGFRTRAGRRADADEESLGSLPSDLAGIRDDMIVLPQKMQKEGKSPTRSLEGMRSLPAEPLVIEPAHTHRKPEPPVIGRAMTRDENNINTPAVGEHPQPPQEKTLPPTKSLQSKASRPRIIMTQETDIPPNKPITDPATKVNVPTVITPPESLKHQETPKGSRITHIRLSAPGDKDAARQRIELELHKQRLKAMTGRGKTADEGVPQQPVSPEPARKKIEIRAKPETGETTLQPARHGGHAEPEQKTVIIPKRKLVSRPQETPVPKSTPPEEPVIKEIPLKPVEENLPDEPDDNLSIAIRDTTIRAKDRIFEGRDVQRQKITTMVKDASLLRPTVKSKNPADSTKKELVVPDGKDETSVPGYGGKKPDKPGKKLDDGTSD
jgi:tubulin-like protein CetZ